MNPNWVRKNVLPRGYEILPIELIEILADAAQRGYAPAFGGSEEAVDLAWHAGQAAKNVLARNRKDCNSEE